MDLGSETLSLLVRAFSRLPGLGAKSAQRIALYLLRNDVSEADALSHLIHVLHDKVRFCRVCGSITEDEECAICKDPGRSRELICVVEQPHDVFVLERTRQYNGLYHVLHGVLSPIDGVGPENLNLRSLEERVRAGGVRKLVIATNPTIEGDTTALYVAKSLARYGCTVTRLARGLPMGATLEFADENTIAQALERREKL